MFRVDDPRGSGAMHPVRPFSGVLLMKLVHSASSRATLVNTDFYLPLGAEVLPAAGEPVSFAQATSTSPRAPQRG
jgi:hypothetical protein